MLGTTMNTVFIVFDHEMDIDSVFLDKDQAKKFAEEKGFTAIDEHPIGVSKDVVDYRIHDDGKWYKFQNVNNNLIITVD